MTRESDIEKYLCDRVKDLGGEVRKVKWIGRNGAPDRLVMLPTKQPSKELLEYISAVLKGPCIKSFSVSEEIEDIKRGANPPRTIWVELKAPGEKCRPHQIREHERMRRMGQRVEVVDSFEGVDEVLA